MLLKWLVDLAWCFLTEQEQPHSITFIYCVGSKYCTIVIKLSEEIKKERSVKTSPMKDKEITKGKDVKVPTSLKEKVPDIKKDEKISKTDKEVKPKLPQPQVKKEEKLELQTKKDAKPASSEKAQIHKKDIVKPEKTVHSKPEEKDLKQVKAAMIEKTVKPKPAKKVEHPQKELQTIKTGEPKLMSKGTLEDTESGKKKIEKSEKESKAEKTTKSSREDTEDVPAAKKAKVEKTEDGSSPKRQKSPISFFQCVYLDGYNGYGFQFPVTPAQSPGESSRKPNSPGLKHQGQ
ncbi:triadin-like [Thomomys bottae]